MKENKTLEYKEKITNTFLKTVSTEDKTPYLYKAKAYKRNDTATIETDTAELRRLILKGSNLSYEELPSDAQDLTFRTLESKLISETGIDSCDLNVLKTLNLYSDKGGYNIAAAILADKNTFHGIDIGKFGETISIIKKRKTLEHCSILALYDFACEMFNDYYRYEVIDGALRKTVSDIPEEAFREAVANALIHRTWDIREHIRIFMFDDRIEIFSPGGLPPGMSEEAYLSGNYSNLRNPIISNVFYRLKIVEIFGTGIRRIKEAYRNSVEKPKFEVSENQIKIILPVLKTESEFREDTLMIYRALSEKEGKPIGEIVKLVPFGKSKTRVILNELVSQNSIYVTGTGRATKYRRK